MTPGTCATRSPDSTRSRKSADAERDQAWKRIKAAAKKHGVEVEAGSWRELVKGGKTGR